MTAQITVMPSVRAAIARANAKRFAEAVSTETDENVKTYLRHIAVSWHSIAEQFDFAEDVSFRRRA